MGTYQATDRGMALRWWHLGPTTKDSALAAAAAAAVFGMALGDRAAAPPLALAGLSVGLAAPLALRRRLPVSVAVVSAAVTLAGMAATGWSGGGLVAATASGSAAYHRPGRTGTVLAVSMVCFLTQVLVAVPGSGDLADGAPPHLAGMGATTFAQAVVLGIAPVAVGYALRLHRERADQVARVHRAEAGRALAEERARIAREVHDAVGHHLTAIWMQAGAARHVLGDGSAVAGRALRTIAESASAALGEVRALLEMLRDNQDSGGATLADVPTLAERLATPSCLIGVRIDGPATPLPALVDHGGYRLVQEALANAVRHARASEIQVRIRRDHRTLTITVADNGPTRPSDELPAEGHGIRGMRERTRLVGGELTITPRQPHGWLIEAVLPIKRAPAE